MSTRSSRAKSAVAAAPEPVIAPAKAAPKKRVTKKVIESSSESEVSEDSSEEEVASESESEPEQKPKKRAPTKKVAAKAVIAPVEPEQDAEAEVEVVVKPKRVTKKAAAAVAPAPSAANSRPVNPVHAQLAALLTEAQHSYHTHSGIAVSANALLVSSPDIFLTSFSAHCAYLCSKSKKEAPTQRVIEWVGGFVARAFHSGASASSGQFAERFLEQLLDWSEAKDKTMRWRSVQLFGELMKNMGEECDLPEWLFDGAVAALLQRAEDKIEAVRVASAAALHRFQSGEERDPVAAMFVRMMNYDTSPLVRRAALEHVAAASSPKAIQALLTRAQDAVPAVRAAAFKAIQAKLHMKQLSLEARARLVRLGFRDRDNEVVKAAKALVEAWLQTKDRDVLRLLRSMAVDTFSEECGLLIAHLVRTGAHKWESTTQPPYASASITPERALYWRVLAETLHTMDGEEAEAALDSVLPDTVELCNLLSVHSADPFITAQLLALTGLSDMADEAGRRELSAQVETLLRNSATSQSLVSPLMKVYRLVNADENDFIRVVLELLSDIHNPLDADDHELAAKRDELEQTYTTMQKSIESLKVQKQACINAENFSGAEALKSQLSVLTAQLAVVEKELNSSGFQDDGTWARLLSIVCDLLENTQRFKLNHPGLAGLRESIIEPGIQHDHLLIQSLGLKALSLYALLDRNTAKASLPMFMYAANHAETLAQQATAMRAVTDILMLFEDLLEEEEPVASAEDAEAEAPVQPPSSKLQEAQALFHRHLQTAFDQGMDAETTEVCVMAVECLAKLLLFGRLPCQAPMLSALMFIFFHPQTDTRITQCLAVFLPGFLLARSEHVETFFHSVLPTLRILTSAVAAAEADSDVPEENVWRGFSIAAAGRAMLSFVAPIATSVVDGRPIQQAFAMEIAAQLAAAPASSHASTLVSLLAVLDFGVVAPVASSAGAEAAAPFLPALRHSLESVNGSLKDKMAIKELTKFSDKLAKMPTAVELAEDETERADAWLEARVAAIQLEQDDERAIAGDEEVASSRSKKASASAAAKKVPPKGKKALRPKTPAKSRRKVADTDSESEEEKNAASDAVEEDDASEEEGFHIVKPAAKAKKVASAAAPVVVASASGRPSRGAKVNAASKMEEERKKTAAMDKIIDAESEDEDDDEEEEGSEEEEEEDEE